MVARGPLATSGKLSQMWMICTLQRLLSKLAELTHSRSKSSFILAYASFHCNLILSNFNCLAI
jgi:hypothetical protein